MDLRINLSPLDDIIMGDIDYDPRLDRQDKSPLTTSPTQLPVFYDFFVTLKLGQGSANNV